MRAIFPRRIGFQPKNLTVYRIYNFTLATLLFLLVLPLLVILSIALLLTQGREIFYRAERLGKDQKVFKIIKFRTLCNKKAKEITQDRTLPAGSNIETPLGGFLRDTRLDELPQLLNIINGDMNLCGPRPVRNEIANIYRAQIPLYDLRFRVKPGLVGPTQAYFGHGASKRLRARMNNSIVNRPVSIAAELMLLSRIGYAMSMKTFNKVIELGLKSLRCPVPDPRRDIWLSADEGRSISSVETISAQQVVAPNLPAVSICEPAMLNIRLQSGGIRKARVKLINTVNPSVYRYTAESDFGEFVIERYALGQVVVPPQVCRQQVKSQPQLVLEAEVGA